MELKHAFQTGSIINSLRFKLFRQLGLAKPTHDQTGAALFKLDYFRI